jgi:hypothetical protein
MVAELISVWCLLLDYFLLGLLFNPKDGDSTCLRNVSGLLSGYTALHLRKSNFKITTLRMSYPKFFYAFLISVIIPPPNKIT